MFRWLVLVLVLTACDEDPPPSRDCESGWVDGAAAGMRASMLCHDEAPSPPDSSPRDYRECFSVKADQYYAYDGHFCECG